MVYLIQRFTDANGVGRTVGFPNLPEEVKNKIVKQIKLINKNKAYVSTKLLVLMAVSSLLGLFFWFQLFKLILSL